MACIFWGNYRAIINIWQRYHAREMKVPYGLLERRDKGQGQPGFLKRYGLWLFLSRRPTGYR
jgi:hypothetical protein